MGGFSGAGFAYGGLQLLNLPKLELAAAFILVSPTVGFVLGATLLVAVSWALRRTRPQSADKFFGVVRLMSAAAYSIGHGGNDAQKTMGIILAVLVAGGYWDASAEEGPFWVALSCHAVMGIGTAMGGWRIIKTLGSKLTKLRSHSAFCAELSGALTLFGATYFKIPVSTTHTITGAVIGVGSTATRRGIRWGLASSILWAWVLTIPASGATGAICLKVFRYLGAF
jgi:PiT family inorganic phosphate transporter